MVDKRPNQRLGQEIYEAFVPVVAEVKAGATDLTGGEVLKVGDSDGRLTIAGADDIVVAIFADGQTLKANATKRMMVRFVGPVVKVRAGGSITRGDRVKAGADGKVVKAATTVTIPTGATAVTSTSAQPTMTVESGIGFGTALDTGALDDLIAVVLH